MERVLEDFHKVCEKYEYVTMEGSGGILCPLCIDEADIRLPEVVKACGLGCLLIADGGLGTINGVGLTAYYLKQQGIALKGIIFNHYETGNLLHEDNRKMCEYYTGVPWLLCGGWGYGAFHGCGDAERAVCVRQKIKEKKNDLVSI